MVLSTLESIDYGAGAKLDLPPVLENKVYWLTPMIICV